MSYCRTIGSGYIMYTKRLNDYEVGLVDVEFLEKMATWKIPEKDHLGRNVITIEWNRLSLANNAELWPDVIAIPNTVTRLGCAQRFPCKTIILPDNMGTVEIGQFKEVKELREIVLSKKTTLIRSCAFESCGRKSAPCDVIIPSACEEMEYYCFGNAHLGYFRWPENTKIIPTACFSGASIKCLDLSEAVLSKICCNAFFKAHIEELRLPYYPLSDEVWQELKNARIGQIV